MGYGCGNPHRLPRQTRGGALSPWQNPSYSPQTYLHYTPASPPANPRRIAPICHRVSSQTPSQTTVALDSAKKQFAPDTYPPWQALDLHTNGQDMNSSLTRQNILPLLFSRPRLRRYPQAEVPKRQTHLWVAMGLAGLIPHTAGFGFCKAPT